VGASNELRERNLRALRKERIIIPYQLQTHTFPQPSKNPALFLFSPLVACNHNSKCNHNVPL